MSAVGNAPQNAFVVDQFVRHLRDIAHGDPRKRDGPTLADGTQSGEDEGSGRCEDDCGIGQRRWFFLRGANPGSAEFAREALMLFAAGNDVDGTAFVPRELKNDVGGAAET